tara:strand:+ start:285 stop:671 length:387 start_codon:yes stop_codon:yes gene_type:complete
MTCFWNGILSAISDFTPIGLSKKPSPRIFATAMKKHNTRVNNVFWNGTKLKEQEIDEMFEAVSDYNINGISNGHLCSICDYFLSLVCEIFIVDIEHTYLNTKIKYTNSKNTKKPLLKFRSNRGHFWKV